MHKILLIVSAVVDVLPRVLKLFKRRKKDAPSTVDHSSAPADNLPASGRKVVKHTNK